MIEPEGQVVPDGAAASNGEPDSRTTSMRIRQPWLNVARVVWVLMLAINVTVAVVGVQLAYAQSHITCDPAQDPTCGLDNDSRLPIDQAPHGISLDTYATLNTVPPTFIAAAFLLVAVFIFWHRSDDRMALLASLALMTFGVSTITPFATAIRFAYPDFKLVPEAMSFLGGLLFGIFMYLFPDGHFSPRC